MNKETPPRPQKPWPAWVRMRLRVVGILLVLLAVRFYIHSFDEWQAGDVRQGYNYRGTITATSFSERVAIVLAIGGVIIFGLSFPSNERTDKDDKDSS
ncbi:MAG TPA: hypothetical protein VG077_13195 [Verrucomicrobiae bacterium]|nr:hypothetical protein [Verrucomicrobiae bacterium]